MMHGLQSDGLVFMLQDRPNIYSMERSRW